MSAKFGKSLAAAIAATWLLQELPAKASEYRIVAEGAAALIKMYDPMVSRVTTELGVGAGVKTPCGETTNGEIEAFYCGNKSTSLIVVSDNALNNIGKNHGKEAVAAVIAHEFGHARQHWVSGFTSDKIWTEVVDELQADCVAGVYMRRATPFPLSEQQFDRVASFMKSIGDYAVSERDWHGTPEMRSASFRFGYRSGSLDKCLASESMNWGKLGERIETEIKKSPETIDSLIKWGQDILK